MQHISRTASVWALLPYQEPGRAVGLPRRKSMESPPDRGTWVKPLKQSFVRNPRLMPMTRIALTLLSGWAGHGGKIETTIGIVAKHLGRSRRQVFRYLQDAMEEGYLLYSKTKDRIGRYTGIRIHLNFGAIRYQKREPAANRPKPAGKLDVTYESDTKKKIHIKIPGEQKFQERLAEICLRNGIDPPQVPHSNSDWR